MGESDVPQTSERTALSILVAQFDSALIWFLLATIGYLGVATALKRRNPV